MNPAPICAIVVIGLSKFKGIPIYKFEVDRMLNTSSVRLKLQIGCYICMGATSEYEQSCTIIYPFTINILLLFKKGLIFDLFHIMITIHNRKLSFLK